MPSEAFPHEDRQPDMSFQAPILLLTLIAVPLVLVFGALVGRRQARYPVSFTNLSVLAGAESRIGTDRFAGGFRLSCCCSGLPRRALL